ncbi:hypothetical protein JTB14_014477 [Gonioctena quinquepunctata]|nr:hypothetical protein JTB14_014477 [Gonioctena quinquepunctata]
MNFIRGDDFGSLGNSWRLLTALHFVQFDCFQWEFLKCSPTTGNIDIRDDVDACESWLLPVDAYWGSEWGSPIAALSGVIIFDTDMATSG